MTYEEHIEMAVADIKAHLESPEVQEHMSKVFSESAAKCRALDEWWEAHKEKPKNLFDAVIRLEEYKDFCMKTFGKLF